jgi:hypothetical protein
MVAGSKQRDAAMFWNIRQPSDAASAVSHCINSRQMSGISLEQCAAVSRAMAALWASDDFRAVCKCWTDDSTDKFIRLSLNLA